MTSCVITDKRSRRVRNFLFPKSFFPARGGEIWGGGAPVRKREAPRVARCSQPSLRPDQKD